MSTILSIVIFVVVISNNQDSFSRAEPLAGWVEKAAELEFPYIVSIASKFEIQANNPYGHICGGVLITRRWVLTATSCFVKDNNRNIIIRDYFVYIGTSNLAENDKFEIQSWESYDSWKPYKPELVKEKGGHLNKDVALLRLSLLLDPITDIAKISCISPSDLEGKTVVTAGWGTFDNIIPQNMSKADLSVLTRDQCLQNVQIATNDPNYDLKDNVICTSSEPLFQALNNGDKGSPLLIKHTDGSYRIVGINLEAVPPADNVAQAIDQQNLHLSVHYFTDFIRKITRCPYLCPSP